MICATIEIWPYGFHETAQPIGKVAIWNRGTSSDPTIGNYGYCITDDFDDRWGNPNPLPTNAEMVHMVRAVDETADEYDFRDDRIIAHGHIDNYPRVRGAHKLLAAVLADAGLDGWYYTGRDNSDGPEDDDE